jgi:hypothetical protein
VVVVTVFTVPACDAQTTVIMSDHSGRHRRAFCSCGWEIWTPTDTKADISTTHAESEVHRLVAKELGRNHPRGRIIAWVS